MKKALSLRNDATYKNVLFGAQEVREMAAACRTIWNACILAATFDNLPSANWIIVLSLCWWKCAQTSPCSGFWMQGIQIFVRSSRNFTGLVGFQSPNHSSFHSQGRTKL